MVKHWLGAVMMLAIGAMAAGCSGAEIGEACETRGSQDECVDGAICDEATSGASPTCLKVCKDATECSADEDCNGVSGSNIKACTPKTK